MNRDEQEMALWRETCLLSRMADRATREAEADAAVAAFRKRYPPQPSAPEAVWYDTPPFTKDRKDYHCWVEGFDALQLVYWSDQYSEWRRFEGASQPPQSLAGRRVCPIAKPPEPTP